MSNGQNIPAKMMSLQLKDVNLLYSSYMPFLEYGGLFVQIEAELGRMLGSNRPTFTM